MANLAIIFVSFLLTINVALALTCYKCDTQSDKSCGWRLLSFTYPTVDCSTESNDGGFISGIASVLYKCYVLVGVDKDDNEYIQRGCFPSGSFLDTCKIMAKTVGFLGSSEVKKLECTTCNTDKCNSASKLTGTALTALLIAFVAFSF